MRWGCSASEMGVMRFPAVSRTYLTFTIGMGDDRWNLWSLQPVSPSRFMEISKMHQPVRKLRDFGGHWFAAFA